MVDIWGRSKRKTTNDKTPDEVKKLIKDEIANNFNLVNVDPGEIVVFGDKQGKLKTSNLSLDDLLTKPPNADDDSIAVFKAGKLAPSYKITTLDKIAEVETDLDSQMKDYKQFRRNVIAKFFGSPLVVTPSLAEVKKSIDDLKQNITDINSRLSVISAKPELNIEHFHAILDENVKSIDGIKKDIDDIQTITDKIKIPHKWFEIEGLSYVVSKNFDIEYLRPPLETGTSSLFMWENKSITGIYRFSLISEYQFNIKIRADNLTIILSQGVNVVLFKFENKTYKYEITPVDPTVLRAKYSYIVEYLSPI